jgi:predicted esterase
LRSGRLFREHGVPGAPLSLGVAPAAELRGRAVWATHGTGDGTTPAALARESLSVAAALYGAEGAAAFAADVRFQAHSGGHEIPAEAMRAACEAVRAWSSA